VLPGNYSNSGMAPSLIARHCSKLDSP